MSKSVAVRKKGKVKEVDKYIKHNYSFGLSDYLIDVY